MQMLIKNLSKLKYLILAVAYTTWLTVISLIPLDKYDLPSFTMADKFVHFFLYLFLVIVWLLACPKLWHKKLRFILLIIFWGVMIEFLQEYVAIHRSGDVFDALANTLGGLAGLGLYQLIHKIGFFRKNNR